MWIGKCKIDDRGRITLPKSFMSANQLDHYTDVYIQTMYNNENCVKLVFVDTEKAKLKKWAEDTEEAKEYDNAE